MYPNWCYPVNGQLGTRKGWNFRVFRGFCDVIDLHGTSQNRILEARVGIEPA